MRRIFNNLGLLLGGKAAAGIISLAYLVIAARALGPGDYGVLVLMHAYALTIDGIINFPGWQAIVRYGVTPLHEGNHERLIRLLRFTAAIEIAVGLIAVMVAAALAGILGPRLGWSAEAQAFALPYSLAVLANVRSTPGGLLQLLGRFDLLGAHHAISPIIRLLGALIAVAGGWGLTGFLVAWLVAALAECFSMWLMGVWAARRRFGHQRLIGRVHDMRKEVPGIGRFMWAANGDATFGQLAPQLAPLAVGWVLGPVAAGLYAVAQRATSIIAQPAMILGQATYAEFSRLVAAGGRGAPLRKALAHSIGIGMLSSVPVILVMALCGSSIAVLIGGEAFAAAASLMLWLALARSVLIVGPTASSALVAMGRPGRSAIANIATSLGMLPFLPLMMLRWGLDAAGVHALLQAVLTSAVLITLVGITSRESASIDVAQGPGSQ